MSPPVSAWLRAFLLTALIEVPLVLALTRGSLVPARRRAALAVFAQLTTHPLVWYVFPNVPGLDRWQSLVLSELWAWLGEAAFYAAAFAPLRPLRAVGVAGVANGLSFGLGLLVPARFFFDLERPPGSRCGGRMLRFFAAAYPGTPRSQSLACARRNATPRAL